MANDEFEKYMEGLEPEEVVNYMWRECSGAQSFFKGSIVEIKFRKIVEQFGGTATKIHDQNTDLRYDFDVCVSDRHSRFEVKTLPNNMCVQIGYKDVREVVLPSGQVWKTRSRCLNENFDYFAVSLVNHAGFTNSDIVCIKFEDLPRLRVKNTKSQKFIESDKQWIKENYIASSIRLKGLKPLDKRFIKIEAILPILTCDKTI